MKLDNKQIEIKKEDDEEKKKKKVNKFMNKKWEKFHCVDRNEDRWVANV